MSPKRVISIEKRALPVTGEGLICEIFFYIRISDGVRDEWLILHESIFKALAKELGRN